MTPSSIMKHRVDSVWTPKAHHINTAQQRKDTVDTVENVIIPDVTNYPRYQIGVIGCRYEAIRCSMRLKGVESVTNR